MVERARINFLTLFFLIKCEKAHFNQNYDQNGIISYSQFRQ